MDGVQKSIDEDDFDVKIDFEKGFVGRENELNELHKAWERHRIFGIFGLRSVGKSRLVKEFFKRYKPEDAVVIQIDMKMLPDVVSLYAIICASLGLQINQQSEETAILIHQIVRFICTTTERHFIFFFDNTEDFQDIKGESVRDSFSTFCSSLIRQCKHVTVFISSTSRLPLTHLGEVYYSYEVLPLKQTETRQLLKNVTAGIELGEYVDTLANLSEGLPLLILMIGSELTEDGGLITPKDMVEFLLTCRLRALSRDFYPEEDRVADVYQKFLDRLDDVYKKSLIILEYIPGTFNADQAKQMLDFNTDESVKEQTLVPIRRRHVLNYDHTTGRFSIQGILRECLSTFYIIENIPAVLLTLKK
ncbi:uncharacterized protein LOC123550887 isoform X2 [Mercenaria mercenaria]|uniref:uncharacterized protein LOC123550887 isoform X2 n=1 Tax=Mercenaria mercenaria TaxID=6596 RepID=UPI00234FA97C|nr:uncharacterized protein LOC123550887 isoform X2 [Mercenaria mercenaria]